MRPYDKIFVAGHAGLVGSALVRRLARDGYTNLLLRTREELDLTDANAVASFFSEHRPDYVFLAAAKVGGIQANSSFPAEFIRENLSIATNVIDQSYRAGVKRLLFLGSSCIYPRLAPQPLREESLLTGPLEFTNRPYAVAKIAGIEMCWAYNRQYGTSFLSAMPTNLYGPGDNYDAQNSHIVPGLIRKMHAAKISGAPQVVVWGTGTPRRELLFSDDAADACFMLMKLPEAQFQSLLPAGEHPPIINIGSGEDLSVREIAERIAQVVGFPGGIIFDSSRPDGTPRKLLDVSRIRALGWSPSVTLADGLERAYSDFCERASRGLLDVEMAMPAGVVHS
jgi:GDP-L-fucose synthase